MYCDVPGSPCLSKKQNKCAVHFSFKIFLLETPPRWHATIYMYILMFSCHGSKDIDASNLVAQGRPSPTMRLMMADLVP